MCCVALIYGTKIEGGKIPAKFIPDQMALILSKIMKIQIQVSIIALRVGEVAFC